jgi:CDP-diacylglycerol--glycerol-3-phosphate 3-phosphatidyltransferase
LAFRPVSSLTQGTQRLGIKVHRNFANIITISRLVATPPNVALLAFGLLADSLFALRVSLGLFLLLCISDTFDGFYARTFHRVSDLGKWLDPLVDKVLVFGHLGCWTVCVWYKAPAPVMLLPTVLMVIRFAQDLSSNRLYKQRQSDGSQRSSNRYGKYKTVVDMAAITAGIYCQLVARGLGYAMREGVLMVSGLLMVATILASNSLRLKRKATT